MTELLCKLFIKNCDDPLDPAAHHRYGTMASTVAIILNVILFAAKFAVGKYVGSVSVCADAMNNLADAGFSVISLISFRIAAKPADRKHPFGHARMEYVTSMIVSFLVLHTAIDVLTESVEKLVAGEADGGASPAVFAVLGAAILVKLWLCIFNRKLAKRTGSQIMQANSADSLSDALSTAAVLASSVIVFFFPSLWRADAVMGVIVGVLILISGIKIFNAAKNAILGETPDGSAEASIRKVISEYPEALGMHDLFIHDYGPGRCIVSLHLEVDGAADIFRSHDVADNIEKELRERFGYIATVHMDPIVTNDERVNALRERVTAAVAELDGRLSLHDFRFVEGETHTNLIFDVAAPFEVKLSDEELEDAIKKKVSEINEGYFAVITVDRQ